MSLGIDVGGTKIIALKMENLNIEERWKAQTMDGNVVNTLKNFISLSEEKIIGIGVPCYLKKGVCVKAPHISELDGFDFSRLFKNAVVVNDCTAMAYGEYVVRGEKYDPLLLVALGTGVGAGLVFRGIPYIGNGSAMELGHIKSFSEKNCFCGKKGCLESVLGGRYENLREMEEKARNGDLEGIKFMENYGRTLGKGLSYAIELLDPEIVVIGGSVANAYDLFIEPLKNELEKYLSFISIEDIIFEKAKSTDSGAIGAALIAERKLI